MWLGFLLFCMIYAPRIGTFGDVMTIWSVGLIFYAWMVGPIEPAGLRKLRGIVLIWLSCMFVYSIAIFLLNSPRELYVPLRVGRIAVQFFGCYALMRLYYRKYSDQMGDKLLLHIFWCVAANAFLMLLMYLIAPFREFIWMLIAQERGRAKRIGGLTGALDSLSVIQAFGVLLLPFIVRQIRGRRILLGVFAGMLLPFSIVVSGRTGAVLLVLVMIPVMILKWKETPRLFLAIILVLLFTVIILAVAEPGENVRSRWDSEIERLTRLITSEKEGGHGTSGGATAKLIGDYKHVWPTSTMQILFGNSRSGRTETNRVKADAGWVVDCHSVGFVGTIMMLFFYYLVLRNAVKGFRFNRNLAVCSILFSVLVLLTHCKVVFLLARTGFTISCVLLLGTLYSRYMSNNDSTIPYPNTNSNDPYYSNRSTNSWCNNY